MTLRFTWPDACAPFALSQLFAEPFEKTCERIYACGGNPYAVTKEVFDRLLAPHGVQQRKLFRRPRVFHSFRRRPGTWVTVVKGVGAATGHCIALRDGHPIGNDWVRFEPGRARYESLRVHAAWRLAS